MSPAPPPPPPPPTPPPPTPPPPPHPPPPPTPIASHRIPDPASIPVSMSIPPEPIVLHGFRLGRRPFSVAVFDDAVVIVQTAPGLRSFGALVAMFISGRRQRRLDQLRPQGAAAVQQAFAHGDLIGTHEITAICVSTAMFGQRKLVIHRSGGAEPSSLPFPRKRLSLGELHAAFAPRIGPRFQIDPDVAALG